jgi:hypothetical protein
VGQFPNRRSSHSHLASFFQLALDAQGVGTTCIGPHARKGDLLVGSFLEEESAVSRAEEEDGECSVEETLVDVGHEMAWGGGESGVEQSQLERRSVARSGIDESVRHSHRFLLPSP